MISMITSFDYKRISEFPLTGSFQHLPSISVSWCQNMTVQLFPVWEKRLNSYKCSTFHRLALLSLATHFQKPFGGNSLSQALCSFLFSTWTLSSERCLRARGETSAKPSQDAFPQEAKLKINQLSDIFRWTPGWRVWEDATFQPCLRALLGAVDVEFLRLLLFPHLIVPVPKEKNQGVIFRVGCSS